MKCRTGFELVSDGGSVMNPLLPLATTLMTGAGSMAPGRPPSPRKAEAFFMCAQHGRTLKTT